MTGLNVAFRVDSSLEIGTGHVMRCLTLANALARTGARCTFLTRRLPGNSLGRIEEHAVHVLPTSAQHGKAHDDGPPHAAWLAAPWQEDARQTRAALDELQPDWLVVDHYALDARWEAVAVPPETRIFVIDDLADRAHRCDLLLDQNLGHTAGDYDGLVPETCTRLVGPRYALLRPEFAEARAEALAARDGRGLRRLMVSMGGIDAADATSAVLCALREAPLPEDLTIEVIMGGQAPTLEKVHELARDMPRPTQVAVDVDDMAARMARADLAIGAGGSTTWERCALGLPSIIVEVAANQAEITRAMVDAGAALSPGPLQAADVAARLRAAVAEAANPKHLAKMSQAAVETCDGNGVVRVLGQLKNETLYED